MFSASPISQPSLTEDDTDAPPISEDMESPGRRPPRRLLRQWASRSTVLCRIIDSAKAEIRNASQDMEVETGALAGSFREVADKAQSQSDRIAGIATMATSVSVDGKEIELGSVACQFDKSLDEILHKIEGLSEHAGSIVGVLEGMGNGLARVQRCIGQVENINRQATMLAVNARIEAARAGAAGGAFGVVANEIGSLSKSTKSMSESMSEDLGQIVAAIDEIRTIVQLVAKVDLSANIELKRSLDSLVEALVKRNGDVGQIVSDAAIDQQLISSQIDQIVTSMQFQDRVAQRLEQVVDTLVVVGDAVEELHQETADATSAEPLEQTPHDIAWLKGLSARYKLSAMRARFVARVIDGNLPDAADCVASDNPSEAGSIELF